jgi:hypothetical protein
MEPGGGVEIIFTHPSQAKQRPEVVLENTPFPQAVFVIIKANATMMLS